MNNGTEVKIVCLYGEYNCFAISIFDPDTYTESSYQTKNGGGQFFKLIVLPEEREKAVICKYKDDGLKCFNYNITSNSFSQETRILSSGCEYRPFSLIMEYFYETEQFIIGCKDNSDTEFYITNGLDDLESFNLETAPKLNFNTKISGRVNIVIPSGTNKYCYLNYGESLVEFGDDSLVIKNTYDVEVATTTLVCDNYYSYNHTVCLDEMKSQMVIIVIIQKIKQLINVMTIAELVKVDQ